MLKRSPPTPATPPRKGGRKIKKEKEEVDVFEKTKEVVPISVFAEHVKLAESSKEEREDNGGREEESGAEDKTDLSRSDILNRSYTVYTLDMSGCDKRQ